MAVVSPRRSKVWARMAAAGRLNAGGRRGGLQRAVGVRGAPPGSVPLWRAKGLRSGGSPPKMVRTTPNGNMMMPHRTLWLAGLLALGGGIVRAGDWQLVWADEFDAPGLPDPAKWTHEEGFVRNLYLTPLP